MLTAKQKKCLELLVSGEMTQKEIASQIKVSEQTICNWKKTEEFSKEYENLMRVCIQSFAAKAFQTQKHLLDARSEMVRYMVSKDILDRAGFKPVDKVEAEVDMDLNITVDYGDGAE